MGRRIERKTWMKAVKRDVGEKNKGPKIIETSNKKFESYMYVCSLLQCALYNITSYNNAKNKFKVSSKLLH